MKSKKNASPPLSIGDLKPDPRNCRKHGQRNIGSLVNTLHSVGAARSIVIDENNVILAGNGLVEAAGEAGITKLKVVEADGETVIAVRRTGLSKKQKAQLAIADNRTAELAEWDATELSRTIAENNIDLKQIEFTEDELAKLVKAAGNDDSEGIAGGIGEKYEVVVECRSESEQREIFERLEALGMACRVLTI